VLNVRFHILVFVVSVCSGCATPAVRTSSVPGWIQKQIITSAIPTSPIETSNAFQFSLDTRSKQFDSELWVGWLNQHAHKEVKVEILIVQNKEATKQLIRAHTLVTQMRHLADRAFVTLSVHVAPSWESFVICKVVAEQ